MSNFCQRNAPKGLKIGKSHGAEWAGRGPAWRRPPVNMTGKIPLILLPGLLCDATLWRHQREYLADLADITVADLTGHDSFAALADMVLAAAPARFALAGLSMGGYVAQEIMRRAPERVLRLALLDSSARGDTAVQARRRRGLIELAGRGRFKGVTPRLLPMLIHPDRRPR